MKVSELITVLSMLKKDQEIYTAQVNEEGKIYWHDFYVEEREDGEVICYPHRERIS